MAQKTKYRRKSSIRLPGWDYTSPGYYFVTICTYQREYLFYDERFRAIAKALWRGIPTRPQGRNHVRLDESVFMPDHFHGILELFGSPNVPLDKKRHAKDLQSGSVGAIVGTFKSIVTKQINLVRGTLGEKVWQRGYYDRIIQGEEEELLKIRQYIRNNPERWNKNRENLDTLLPRMRHVSWVN
jgi:REP element-mobilizing transposase RayT